MPFPGIVALLDVLKGLNRFASRMQPIKLSFPDQIWSDIRQPCSSARMCLTQFLSDLKTRLTIFSLVKGNQWYIKTGL